MLFTVSENSIFLAIYAIYTVQIAIDSIYAMLK